MRRSHWWTLAAAGGCMLVSVSAFFLGAWPVGTAGFVGYLVAMNRWVKDAEAEGRHS